MLTVASSYLRSAFDTCVSNGCSKQELLKIVPGGAAALENPLSRLPRKSFIDMLHKAEEMLGETGIGVRVGHNFRPTTFFDFGSGLMACATLREAMAFNAKYQAVNQQLGKAKLIVNGTSAIVAWDTPDEPDYMRPATEAVFAGYVRMGKWLTWTQDSKLLSMRFRHGRPDHADLVEEVYECPILYNHCLLYTSDAADE